MSMKNFFKKLTSFRKRYIVAALVGLSVAVAVPLAVKAGYGPNRPVFDYSKPCNPNDGDPYDRCGSLTGPVFNSFVNTPSYGDERAFVDARDSNVPKAFADTLSVEAGKEYTVRAYVHNNANQGTNDAEDNFKGIAKNTTVRFKVLEGVSTGNEVTGYVSADNVAPGFPSIVYDTVKLQNSSKPFSLEYVAGSARAETNAHPFPGVALPDSIVTSGAKIGYSEMNGDMPGCFEFTAIVTIKVRVKSPKIQVSKTVSTVEAPKLADTHESIEVDRGDTVTWRIDYKNTGNDVARDVTIRDTLPKGVTLVPDSITLIDAKHQSGQKLPDTALTSGGVNVGDYAVNGNGVIRFRTTVDEDAKECELPNVAFARGEHIPEVSDKAKITIRNCVSEQPKYSCGLLKKESLGNRKYRFSVEASTSGGAKVNHYIFDFGDGSEKLVTDQTVVTHQYPKTGSFVATVKVNVQVDDNEVKIAESAACSQSISSKALPPELPDTGAGGVIGIFSAVTVAGALFHRRFLAKT